MQTTALDAKSLKLHADNSGIVWYIIGDSLPECSNLKWSQFIQEPILKKAKYIRLIGSVANSKTISILYGRKLSGELHKLEVCSPVVCPAIGESCNPETTLYTMRRWQWPASLGGWHEVTAKDYASYVIAAELGKNAFEVNDSVRRLIKSHPVYKSVSFISGLNYDNLAKLIGMILDPRWFIDFEEPDSCSRLKSHIGLTPVIQNQVSNNKLVTPHAKRCKIVLDTWKTTDKPPENIHHPSNFLWRIFLAAKKPVEGNLRASQSFITFMRHSWLSELYNNNHAGEEMFVPEHFFKYPEEAQAFRKHLEKQNDEQ